jgi:hypothetical protein
MKRDELTQGFGISGSQHLGTWNQQKKLGTLRQRSSPATHPNPNANVSHNFQASCSIS